MFDSRLLFLILVVLAMQQASAYGLTVSSYLRTPQRNAEVGGVANSLHLVGLAVDLVGPWLSLQKVAAVWRSWGLDAVLEDDHLHLELDGPALRA